mmetsp:Transcript_10512/g.21408  ORF Transcript_10512/g.21408 Transcript_10512/m.21408 type:complete len:229 (-) Transcript_10512:162-848(-)
MNFICLSNFHPNAVFPFIGPGVRFVVRVVVMAAKSILHFSLGKGTAVRNANVSVRTTAIFVILADRVVFGSKMPVNIDGAHGALPVILGVGDYVDFHQSLESLGDVSASLRTRHVDAVNVVQLDRLLGTYVGALVEDGGDLSSGPFGDDVDGNKEVVRSTGFEGGNGLILGSSRCSGCVAGAVVLNGKRDGGSKKSDSGESKHAHSGFQLGVFVFGVLLLTHVEFWGV